MRLPPNIKTLKHYELARRLHNLGMMPKLIMDFIPVSTKYLRGFGESDNKLLFSRGYSRAWTNTNVGFKMANILFKIYGTISDDPSLQKNLDVNHIATAWEVATIQYPELIKDQICDISRFTYLLKKIVSNEYLVSECVTNNCSKKFIAHEDSDRHFCWACADNYSSIQLNKMGKSLDIESQVNKYTLYAPKERPQKDNFSSAVFLQVSQRMFISHKIAASSELSDSDVNNIHNPMVVNAR